MSERQAERRARKVECPTCSAAPGKPCVYTDGPYRGQLKASGYHGARGVAAADAELDGLGEDKK